VCPGFGSFMSASTKRRALSSRRQRLPITEPVFARNELRTPPIDRGTVQRVNVTLLGPCLRKHDDLVFWEALSDCYTCRPTHAPDFLRKSRGMQGGKLLHIPLPSTDLLSACFHCMSPG